MWCPMMTHELAARRTQHPEGEQSQINGRERSGWCKKARSTTSKLLLQINETHIFPREHVSYIAKFCILMYRIVNDYDYDDDDDISIFLSSTSLLMDSGSKLYCSTTTLRRPWAIPLDHYCEGTAGRGIHYLHLTVVSLGECTSLMENKPLP